MGTVAKIPNKRSDMASDATNRFGIVRMRLFNATTTRVAELPTTKRNKMSA